MLRTTTTATVRAFRPVQVSAVARRCYTNKFSEKELAEEAQFIRAREAEKAKIQEQLAQKEKEIADLKAKAKSNGKK
ncbi:hypothetical protein BGZ76_008808 [Entomortierella beljakovae]|nr:hypothetical protein BGZ76_008808 [Entomortierella beljakovae]